MAIWAVNKDESLVYKVDGQLVAAISRKRKDKTDGYFGVIYGEYPDIHRIALWDGNLTLLKAKITVLVT